MRPTLAALALLAALASPAAAETARVVDGDTLDVAGTRYRLWGIDSPESAQICTKDAQVWPCGAVAADHLRRLISGAHVECEHRVTDRYGRSVALCRVEGRDLSAAMVEAGMALAFRRYSLDYVLQEDRAREAKRGMWQGEFVAPWDFRREKAARR